MYSRFSVLKAKQYSKKMKTNSPAPMGADPIGSFLAGLSKAPVLHCKGSYCKGKKSIYVEYSHNGAICCAGMVVSYPTKGGES
jgi:hypothetical protein